MSKLKIKKGDKIRVIAGEHKGSEGNVMKILIDKNKAIIEGVNLVKKHAKPSAQNPQGGIKEFESPIQISNLSLLTGDGKIIPCPTCKSLDTKLISPFGSTACKASFKCNACLEPFEHFKCI